MSKILRRKRRHLGLFLGALLIVVTAATMQQNVTHTSAASWNVTGDVGALPQRPDIALSALPSGDMPIDANGSPVTTPPAAVALAEKQFNLSDDQIDNNVGLVRALVSVRGDAAHTNIPAWIVTANMDIMGQGPATDDLVYHKLCIVINAASGSYSFAYAVDPQVVG